MPHVHWWTIDEPHGTPLLHGRCKGCGAERDDFLAAMPTAFQYGPMPGGVLPKGITEDIAATHRAALAMISGGPVL